MPTVTTATTKDIVIKQHSTELTHDQIKNLPLWTQGKVLLVPPQGEGKWIYFMGALFYKQSWAAGYLIRDEDGLIISHDTASLNQLDQSINESSTASAHELSALLSSNPTDTYILQDGQRIQSNSVLGSKPIFINSGTTELVNKGLVLAGFSNTTDPWDDGDAANTLTVTVFYSVLDI